MKSFLQKTLSSKSKLFLIKAFFALLLTAHSSLLTSQTPLRTVDLKSQEPSWYAVIGGNAVSPCIETSYGAALLSDGRLLSACTSEGNVIWQQSIKGRPTPYICSFGDFLIVVTDNNKLNLVNPSGLTIWTSTCPFPITDYPIIANDGRIFVKGKKSVACYGLDGTRKWKSDTEELGTFPISLLDDGSILLFLKAPKNNRTIANRFSAFGERLEDITFSGIVSSTENADCGVLVSLTNGSIGLVSKVGDTADSKWVNGSGNTNGAFRICWSKFSGNTAFFFNNGNRTEAVIVETETGELLNRFQVGNIASADFRLAKSTKSGYFISGTYSACEFGEDGTIFYAALLPPKAKWTSIFYTGKNYLVLCMNDWTMKGFLMNQTPKSAQKSSSKARPITYVSAVDFDETAIELGIRPLTNQKMAEISKAFEAGDYGKNEKEYLELLKTEAENYIKAGSTQASLNHSNSNFFIENAVYTQNLLYLMSKTGTREFSLFFSQLLSGDIDSSQLLSIVSFAGKLGYDEDGRMLLAIENLVTKKLQPSQTVLLKAICDTTYEICRFMGRPALNKRGKNILSYLMRPQYDKTVQDYSRKTLEKMITLEKK